MTTYSYSDILQQLEGKLKKELNVCMPAAIEKYDHLTQKASVLIDVQKVYGKDSVQMPVIHNLPVLTHSSGGAYIHLPINKGDACIVVFSDSDITDWKNGKVNAKPPSIRSHDLSDGVVIMGLSRFTKPLPVKNNNDVVIEYANTTITIQKTGVVDIVSKQEVHINTDKIIANCKTSEITASDKVSVECKSANVKASDNVELNCKNADIIASEKVAVNCANAEIKASGAISTDSPTFTQKGNLKIDGLLEVTQTAQIAGKLTTKAGIENSGANLISNGKTFETHTHSYQNVSDVLTAEGPAQVIKIPTNSGVVQ